MLSTHNRKNLFKIRIKFKFEFNMHETKIQRPSIEQVVAQIDYKNIWNDLGEFWLEWKIKMSLKKWFCVFYVFQGY